MADNPPAVGHFEEDPRAHIDKETGKWQWENDSGELFEWTGKVWYPLLDDELIKAQQSAYSVEGVDEKVPAAPVLAREEKLQKRKQDDGDGPRSKKQAKVKPVNSAPKPPAPPKKTGVWVTNLPPNATPELLASVFSKAGVLHVGDDGKPRVKLYYEDDGRFKGEALVMYFKEGSVDLAITLLDDTELELGAGYGNMRVRIAEYDKAASKAASKEATNKTDEAAPQPEKKHISAEAKQRMSKRMRALESKLAWHSDSDDDVDRSQASSTSAARFNRVVVLRGMFQLKDLEEEPALLLELKEDVRDEAETLGRVTSVVLYDKEEDGVMTIKFQDPTAAQACVMKMNGRFFDQRRISATLYSGRERFRKSGGQAIGDDDDSQEQERLDKFAEWLAASEE